MEISLVLKYLELKPQILECFSMLGGMAKQPSLSIISRDVAALREAQKWSQAELAKKAGVSQKVISNLENAESLGIHPTLHTICAVASALNVSLFALMLPLDVEQLRSVQDPNMARLIDTYLELPPSGRQTVDRIIDLESRAMLPAIAVTTQLQPPYQGQERRAG